MLCGVFELFIVFLVPYPTASELKIGNTILLIKLMKQFLHHVASFLTSNGLLELVII